MSEVGARQSQNLAQLFVFVCLFEKLSPTVFGDLNVLMLYSTYHGFALSRLPHAESGTNHPIPKYQNYIFNASKLKYKSESFFFICYNEIGGNIRLLLIVHITYPCPFHMA